MAVGTGVSNKWIEKTGPLRPVVLVCNAPLDAEAETILRRRLRKPPPPLSHLPRPLLVGVDGGAARLTSLGITPDVVTGDFDSLTADDLDELERRGATIVPTPDQDLNDLDKAMAYVLARPDVGAVSVFGATGGRIDHAYSALSVLIKYGKFGGFDELIEFIDGTGTLTPLRCSPIKDECETSFSAKSRVGRTLSLLAFGTVRGVTLTGTRWTLDGATLAPGVRDGTLNEITEPDVRIKHINDPDSTLLVYLHHAPPLVRRVAR